MKKTICLHSLIFKAIHPCWNHFTLENYKCELWIMTSWIAKLGKRLCMPILFDFFHFCHYEYKSSGEALACIFLWTFFHCCHYAQESLRQSAQWSLSIFFAFERDKMYSSRFHITLPKSQEQHVIQHKTYTCVRELGYECIILIHRSNPSWPKVMLLIHFLHSLTLIIFTSCFGLILKIYFRLNKANLK